MLKNYKEQKGMGNDGIETPYLQEKRLSSTRLCLELCCAKLQIQFLTFAVINTNEDSMMEYDKDKVDEYTLALLYLVTHEVHEGIGARAWKGFDWDTMNRLHEKGYISNPIGKAKSAAMDEKAYKKAEDLFKKYFVSD
jgi:hypothetical protein